MRRKGGGVQVSFFYTLTAVQKKYDFFLVGVVVNNFHIVFQFPRRNPLYCVQSRKVKKRLQNITQ